MVNYNFFILGGYAHKRTNHTLKIWVYNYLRKYISLAEICNKIPRLIIDLLNITLILTLKLQSVCAKYKEIAQTLNYIYIKVTIFHSSRVRIF